MTTKTMLDADAELAQVEAKLARLETVDPDPGRVDDTGDLQAVAVAADRVAASQAQLVEAVEVARAHGRSWTEIGFRLGVSRQAARQRFGGTP